MAADRPKSHPSPDRLKIVRDWFDVLAKTVIAIVGVLFAFYADDYRQKTSIVTLLSQREAAESKLKSDMLQHLIGPFVGRAEGDKPLDATRARVLLDLLALNFHTHFELKPLLLDVDAQLQEQKQDRNALRSIARRVVDRQIAMLVAAGSEPQGNWLTGAFSAASLRAGQADLYFEYVEELNDPGVTLLAAATKAGEERVNGPLNPALFANGVGQGVCSVSPNNAHAVRVRVEEFDAKEGTAKVAWSIGDHRACEAVDGVVGRKLTWRDVSSRFTLTPYDFPLTDNAQLDAGQRFALNLYQVTDEASNPLLHLKLAWFPPGYITERERPMNYYQVNKTLGLQ